MENCESCSIKFLNPLKSLTRDELIRKSHCKTTTKIKKGDILFDEGDHLNGVFCIKDGICKVSKMSENGREQIIHLVKKGDLLGERNLISQECSNLKSTALTDMEVCFIPGDEVIQDLNNNPKFTMDVLKKMASALKNTDDNLVSLGQKTVKQRLAYTLVYLEEKFGKSEEGNINISLSREDIASILGTTTETTIRLISGLKKSGLINVKGKAIELVELDKLKLLAHS